MHKAHCLVNCYLCTDRIFYCLTPNAISAYIVGMKLDQYLSQHDIKEAEFAALVHVTQSTINRLRKGQIPSKELMVAIFEQTGGEVRADDFFDISDNAA